MHRSDHPHCNPPWPWHTPLCAWLRPCAARGVLGTQGRMHWVCRGGENTLGLCNTAGANKESQPRVSNPCAQVFSGIQSNRQ